MIKYHKKVIIVLIIATTLFTLSLLPINGSGCSNGPNYWGDAYPGDLHTDTRYQHPYEPSEYKFGSSAIPESKGYDGSHYGTHDWIADAAIRSLRDPIKNPLGFSDWSWLLNSKCASNKWPVWKSYSSLTNHHEVIRSYMTFLFGTQMPDMRKSHFPQNINILKEGVLIGNSGEWKWVGKTDYHSYHFIPESIGSESYAFIPENPEGPRLMRYFSKEAIKCIGNKVRDEKGIILDAMQPEGAAGWLGVMTHYFADLVVPAHLLKPNSRVYHNGYHTWFEKQLASLTKWDKSYKANGGPETKYFSWDISKIGMTGEWTGFIIPIRPDYALTSLAWHAIEIAYRKSGNHQHVIYDGTNDEKARNSGLYINSSTESWDWKIDLDNNGRLQSPHKYFYEKVEKLLIWAGFFTACAMQYILNEGKEESGQEQFSPDFYTNRDPEDFKSIVPDDDPQRKLDDFLNTDTNGNLFKDKFKKLFENIGTIVSPILRSIATMLGSLFLIGR